MRIAVTVVSIYTPRQRRNRYYLHLVRRTHLALCNTHGFTFVHQTVSTHPERAPAWQKINLLLEQLRAGHDVVVILDSDAMVVDSVKENLVTEAIRTMGDADILICTEDWENDAVLEQVIGITERCEERSSTAVNSGFVVVRNTSWSNAFFRRVWEATGCEKELHDWPWEQKSVIARLRELDRDELRAHVCIVGGKRFNNPVYPPVPGQMVMHMMGMGVRNRNARALALWEAPHSCNKPPPTIDTSATGPVNSLY